jgi:Lon protease-like protein
MVHDSLAGGGALGVVMLRDTDDAPIIDHPVPLHRVACAGRIVHSEDVEGGTKNILVHGLHRVHLIEEIPTAKAYRRFCTSLMPVPNPQDLDVASPELARLQSCILSLRTTVAASDTQLLDVLATTEDPVQLADILGAVLIHDPETRQRVLETPDIRPRIGYIIDAIADLLVRVGEQPRKSRMN